MKVGVITVDLTDIKTPKGEQAYKDFFEQIEKGLKENELWNIE